MTNQKQQTPSSLVLSAYSKILHEALAFTSARLFLLTLHVGSLKDEVFVKVAHEKFMEKLRPHYRSPSEFFMDRCFISLVAEFELFLQDMVVIVVTINPKKVGQVEFKLADILDSSGNEELVRRGIEATLNKIMYKKPMAYLSEIADLLSIDKTPLEENWVKFVEAKARRDLGVHNGWKCNSIYLKKIEEVGLSSEIAEGESAFPRDGDYVESVGRTITELAWQICEAVNAKHSSSIFYGNIQS